MNTLRIRGEMPTDIRIEQYAGAWAIEEQAANMLIQTVNGLNLADHIAAARSAVQHSTGYSKYTLGRDGVAIISVAGAMTKYGSSLSENGSTIRARKALRSAVSDSDVKSILMEFETPGGTVAGTKELADDIAAAAESKPVWSYCNDLCASAGYWAASHATKVFANQMAMVGSIGTYAVIRDYSKAFEQSGVKVHIVRAGQFKGAGVMGAKVTDDQLAYFQDIVSEHNQHFVDGVQQHRRLSSKKMQSVADGRVHTARNAMQIGLIDGIQSLEATIAQLAKQSGGTTRPQMSAIQRWDNAVTANMEGGKSKSQAIRQAAKENPELHSEYLQEFNAK